MVTYTKSVRMAARRLRALARRKVLGSSTTVARRFAQGLSHLSIGRAARGSKKGGSARALASSNPYQPTTKVRKTRAYDVYVSEKFAEQPPELSLTQKRRRIDRLWKGLSAEEKSVYFDGRAAGMTATKLSIVGEGFKKFCENEAVRNMPTQLADTMRRRAILESLREMQHHNVWASGAAVHCIDSGLKVEKVLEGTDIEMKSAGDQHFKYDGVPLENPQINPKVFTVCSLRFGGLCEKDPEARRCCTATKNLHKLVLEQLPKPITYPLLLHIEIEATEGIAACGEYHFLTRFVGRGEVGTMVELDMEVAGSGSRRCTLKDVGEGECAVATSQMVFRRLLRDAGARPVAVNSFAVHCYDFLDDPDSEGFAISIATEHFNGTVALASVQRAPKKPAADEVWLPFGLSMSMEQGPPEPNEPSEQKKFFEDDSDDNPVAGEDMGKGDDDFSSVSSEGEPDDGDKVTWLQIVKELVATHFMFEESGFLDQPEGATHFLLHRSPSPYTFRVQGVGGR